MSFFFILNNKKHVFFFYKKKNKTLIKNTKKKGGVFYEIKNTTKIFYCMTPIYLQKIARTDMVLANPISNVMQIAKIEKCVISSSSTSFALDQKKLISTLSALELICGQKFQVTRARQSIAAFKLREGTLIGCKSTLRGHIMWGFLEKCTTIALPRMRLLPYTLNGQRDGSLNFPILNLLLFPELENNFELFEGVAAIHVNLSFHVNCRKEGQKRNSFLSALQIASLPGKRAFS